MIFFLYFFIFVKNFFFLKKLNILKKKMFGKKNLQKSIFFGTKSHFFTKNVENAEVLTKFFIENKKVVNKGIFEEFILLSK